MQGIDGLSLWGLGDRWSVPMGVLKGKITPLACSFAFLSQSSWKLDLLFLLFCGASISYCSQLVYKKDESECFVVKKCGRNDPCHCGSGKKYKKCCLGKDMAEETVRRSGEKLQKQQKEQAKKEREYYEFDEIVPLESSDEWADYEDDEEATAEEAEYNSFQSSPSKKPRAPWYHKRPKPSAEQERIIDEWWEKTKPLWDLKDSGKMMQSITNFMVQHPDLMVHLGIEHEFLFELGSILGREGRWTWYVNLLQRIRREHPDMYALSFGYYDNVIITELVKRKEFEQIPRYFNFYHEYPDADPDNLASLIDTLACGGCQDELFEFVRPIAGPIWKSPHVINGDFAAFWLIIEKYVPLLESSMGPEKAAKQLIEDLKEIEFADFHKRPVSELEKEFYFCFNTPDEWDYDNRNKKEKRYQFCDDIEWNYIGYLHNEKGFSWVRAIYLGEHILGYLYDSLGDKKRKHPFNFTEKMVTSYIEQNNIDLFGINGLRTYSLLEALHYFSHYLVDNEWIDEDAKEEIQEICLNLSSKCYGTLDQSDPALRLFFAPGDSEKDDIEGE